MGCTTNAAVQCNMRCLPVSTCAPPLGARRRVPSKPLYPLPVWDEGVTAARCWRASPPPCQRRTSSHCSPPDQTHQTHGDTARCRQRRHACLQISECMHVIVRSEGYMLLCNDAPMSSSSPRPSENLTNSIPTLSGSCAKWVRPVKQ